MTVKELISELKKTDPNRIVIMAKDAEGNNHSPLYSFWEGAYQAENTWSGSVGLEALTEKDVQDGYSEEDVLKGERAVILIPTN